MPGLYRLFVNAIRYRSRVKRILLTGMSGTGKSTLIHELATRGYKAIDADDWSEYRIAEASGEREWLWREGTISELLDADDVDALFLGGCASNQVRFYAQFDHTVLLSAPIAVLLERLATRTNNSYGKHPDELEQVRHNKQTVEPLLRRIATTELDASAPIDQLIATIIELAGS